LLLSSKKFQSKSLETLKETLETKPKYVLLDKKLGGGQHGCVVLEGGLNPSEQGGIMLYTSGTTNRPVEFSKASKRKEKALIYKLERGLTPGNCYYGSIVVASKSMELHTPRSSITRTTPSPYPRHS
jgi:hypothetical protein